MKNRVVVVTGATGSQGGAAVRALVDDGATVRALTRRPDSKAADALRARGALPVKGDLDDADSLARACEGADVVFAVTEAMRNGAVAEERHGRALVDAATHAGVGHFVFTSVASADRAPSVPHFVSKHRIEQHIVESALPFTILRPAIFMEDLTEAKYFPPASFGMIAKIVGRDRPLPWVSVDDIGRAVARIVRDPAPFVGQTLPLVGDVHSIAAARALFARVDGKRPFALPIPNAIFRRFISEDLFLMWQWLAREEMERDRAPLATLVDGPKDMEQFLRARRRP